MDAKEFLEIIAKECSECTECRFYYSDEKGCGVERVYIDGEDIDKVIAIAEEIKRNKKTYKDDFLSKFPNAKVYSNNAVAGVCRNKVYNMKGDCISCNRCWNEEYKGARTK